MLLASFRLNFPCTVQGTIFCQRKQLTHGCKDQKSKDYIVQDSCMLQHSEKALRRTLFLSVLVSAGVFPTLSSYGKTKSKNPYDEKRLLQQNRRIQKENNAPEDFPNFVREGFQVKVVSSDNYIKSDSGLIYRDFVVGQGDCPKDGQQVTFHYIGYNESAKTQILITMASLHYLPPVKPSAIALGTAFNHAVSLAVLGPVFGDAYRRAQQANSKEEYFHTKEAATAAASWGSSILGSGIQAYGVGALINATGTLTYKGAAYLGSLIFFASAAPSIVSQVVTEKRPMDTIAVGAVARVLETVGLSLFLTYWGTRTNPFD